MSTLAQLLPKAEIHVHLEGAIQPETLLQLATRHGIPLPASDLEGVREFYRFKDFLHFIEVYTLICRCLREPADFHLVTREFLRNQARQNILYTEAFFAPGHFLKQGADLGAIVSAIRQAADEAEREDGVRFQLIADISREMGAEFALEITREVLRVRDRGILALGIGGAEADFPAEWFEESFALARSAGMPVVAHAGEAAGPESVWNALRVLGARRIGHGFRAIEDASLVAHLVAEQVPLEVCPTSNLRIGLVESYDRHPLLRLLEAGCFITLNSDDPPMFNTDLVNEYEVARTVYGLSPAQLFELACNAVRASFLPDADKVTLLGTFRARFEAIPAELRS
jgi:aminodeoxyfutalosine deaminase